jgi:hypothetical protein
MLQTIVVGALLGGLITLAVKWRSKLVRARQAQRREQLAVIVMYAEMTAAIAALDLALRDGNSKWLASMSESRTLSEAWRDHGEALVGLGNQQWAVLSDAVNAVAPNYALTSASPQTHGDLRRSLTARRQLLVEGARILRSAHQEQGESASPHSEHARSLSV